MNLAQILSQRAKIFGRKTAITFKKQERSFVEMDQQIRKTAGVLKKFHLGKKDRVALLLPKGWEFIEIYLGALSLGAVILPLNPAYQPEELRYFLSDSETSLLVTIPEKVSELTAVFKTSLPFQVLLVGPTTPAENHYFYRMDTGDSNITLPYPTDPGDLALLCYTSGTTGRSKGAMITHGNLIQNMRALHLAWRWTSQDRLLHVLPLFHIHGLAVALHGGLYAGAAIILEEGFDPSRAWGMIEEERCTILMAVPTIYQRLSLAWQTMERKPNLESMRVFISGSAPLPEPLFYRFKDQTGHILLERYGMTETGMIASNPYEPESRKVKSVGYPLGGVEIRVVGKDGQEAMPGTVGEVWIKGDNVFKGYWKQPDKTAESFEEGWFKSGDLGYQDPKDFLRLYLVGRGKELIISGGYNVYPKEIENILESQAAVQEAAVFGLAHEDLGEQVVAAVVLKEGYLSTPEELIAFSKTRLAGYKCPKKIFFRSALPRNSMGKLQKHLLKKEYQIVPRE
ncbi:MAG: o-succinylbenzoate--CoA ligase [Desulfobacca sp.]|nr:o-succinylbenzoate--CoA ligase [Desulfobacca sp.]